MWRHAVSAPDRSRDPHELRLCRLVATVLFKSLQLANAGVGSIFHTGLFLPTTRELLITKPLRVISGSVPQDLDGYYFRTGPNPQFEPIGG